MLIKTIVRFIKFLNSNSRLAHLAIGGACGLALALIPSKSLIWIVLFLLLFFTKIHYGFQMLVLLIGKLLVPLFDPLLDKIGYWFLTLPSLQDFFTRLANTPFIWLTNYNNTIVAGAILSSLIIFIPGSLIFALFISIYRKKLEPLIVRSKFVARLKKIPLIVKLGKIASST